MTHTPADIPLIDTHAHLDQVADLEGALQRAHAAGVTAIVAIGMNLLSCWQVLNLAKKNKGFVYPALGIHPWAVEESELEETSSLLKQCISRCVAIGEVGLDLYCKKDLEVQRKVLRTMLGIAADAKMPVLTHSRGGYEEVFRIVQEYGIKDAIFHWYTGPMEVVEKIIESGYFISATPAVEYDVRHREVIEHVPLENLLLETDCPVRYKETISEPATIRVTLREVAKLKKIEPAIIAKATTENAIRLFRF